MKPWSLIPGIVGIAAVALFGSSLPAAAVVTLPTDSGAKLLQFTSGGHVIGFTPNDLVVATGSHALRVVFVAGAQVTPVASGAPAAAESEAAPLGRVAYANLWEGITLAYDAPAGGLLRSTYTVAPRADPALIRLRYNATLSIEPGGELKIAYATGAMHESAPIAWQEIGGKRVPVRVAFREIDANEVGFALGAYDRGRMLWIDPTLQWNTFLGSSDFEAGYGIAVDGSGNVFVTGDSCATWGSPVLSHSGHQDVFVAQLNSSGVLQWNTFLGPSD